MMIIKKSKNQTISTLKELPQHLKWVQETIEKEFSYSSSESFFTDFYPLMGKHNHHSCFILLEDDLPIGHIAVHERYLGLKKIPVALFGGVVMKKEFQGKGIFPPFFKTIINYFRPDNAYLILWSEKEKLFRKFGFSPVGLVFESKPVNTLASNTPSEFKEVLYKNLSLTHKKNIQTLYDNYYHKKTISLIRNKNDWENISNITSAKLMIKMDSHSQIISYFFLGKGQDLPGVVHEYVPERNLDSSFLKSYCLWHPFPEFQDKMTTIRYTALLALGDIEVDPIYVDSLPFFIAGLDSI